MNLKHKRENLKHGKRKNNPPNGQLLKSTNKTKEADREGGHGLAPCLALCLFKTANLVKWIPLGSRDLSNQRSSQALALHKRKKKQHSGLHIKS